MKHKLSAAWGALLPLICIGFLAILTNCGGGGTEGSGLRTISGIAQDSITGSPSVGIAVIIQETGDSAVTDDHGEFSIDSPVSGDSITLRFENGTTLATQATVPISTPEAPEIALQVRIDVRNNSVIVRERLPTPTATAAATQTAHATPTPGPINTPTAIATPTNTSIPTPTPFVPGRCDCDLDGSGFVNANDFQHALNDLAMGDFDFNRDGLSNTADLTFFQQSCEGFSSSGATCP